MRFPPMVMRMRLGSLFSGRTLQTTLVSVISDLRSAGIFLKRMSKKVSVTLNGLLVPSGEEPIHWQRRPSLLEYELFQTLWKSGCCLSCRYSKVCSVALSRTVRAHFCIRAEG